MRMHLSPSHAHFAFDIPRRMGYNGSSKWNRQHPAGQGCSPDREVFVMSDKKIVFLDVDGTLVDYNGDLPASAVQAVRAARGNGHRV